MEKEKLQVSSTSGTASPLNSKITTANTQKKAVASPTTTPSDQVQPTTSASSTPQAGWPSAADMRSSGVTPVRPATPVTVPVLPPALSDLPEADVIALARQSAIAALAEARQADIVGALGRVAKNWLTAPATVNLGGAPKTQDTPVSTPVPDKSILIIRDQVDLRV